MKKNKEIKTICYSILFFTFGLVSKNVEQKEAEIKEINKEVKKEIEQEKKIIEDDDISSEQEQKTTQNDAIENTRNNKGSIVHSHDSIKPLNIDDKELLSLQFEDADCYKFCNIYRKHYKIRFITDDAIKPTPQGDKNVLGNKITFKSYIPLTKKQVWDIFLSFLDMAGLAVVPGPTKDIYRITIASPDPKLPFNANKAAIPTFIGTDPNLLPDNDTRIRYVYFVENAPISIIKSIIDNMRSASFSTVIDFPELRAIIMTDKASTIKSFMKVVVEVDKSNIPEMLSVIKLKNTDAAKAAELYKSLSQPDGQQQQPQFRPRNLTRKSPTTSYFSENTRVIAEPRTNSLIVLGTRDAIKRIEDFLRNAVDTELDMPYSPLHVIELKFIDSEITANIINQATQFQTESISCTNRRRTRRRKIF